MLNKHIESRYIWYMLGLAAFAGVSTLGAIPISLVSNRVGRRKIFLIPLITIAIISIGSLSIADGVFMWVIVIKISDYAVKMLLL